MGRAAQRPGTSCKCGLIALRKFSDGGRDADRKKKEENLTRAFPTFPCHFFLGDPASICERG